MATTEHRYAEARPVTAEAASEWPLKVTLALTSFTVDQHMIAYYEGRHDAEVKAFQAQCISRLLSHVLGCSEWWRDWVRSATDGTRVAFYDLPACSRADYRSAIKAANGPLPIPPEHGSAFENFTSGSSGIPVVFHHTTLCARLNRAHYDFDLKRQNVRMDLLHARINNRQDNKKNEVQEISPDFLLGRPRSITRGLRHYSVEDQARWLANMKPAYIVANTGLLEAVLDAYEDESVKRPENGIVKALLCYSETVTSTFRSKARSVLGARVIDRYSCEEAGPIAFQCPVSDDHYHIAMTNVLVEIVDESGLHARPGEIGRVLVTSLHNFACPVIRYELGDLAAWEPRCVCGYGKPVLTRLLGRVRFLIRLPNGERKHVRTKPKDWLAIAPFQECRIVQTSEYVIRAECVLDYPMKPSEKLQVEAMLKHEVSPDLIYEVSQVDRIDWGPTYKRQDVVSLV